MLPCTSAGTLSIVLQSERSCHVYLLGCSFLVLRTTLRKLIYRFLTVFYVRFALTKFLITVIIVSLRIKIIGMCLFSVLFDGPCLSIIYFDISQSLQFILESCDLTLCLAVFNKSILDSFFIIFCSS